MIRYSYCKYCKTETPIKSNTSTRGELQMEKGDEFNVNCSICGKNEKKHINDIKAKPNKKLLIIGLIIGIIVTGTLLFSYGAISFLSFSIPLLIWAQESKNANSFNKYTVRRK